MRALYFFTISLALSCIDYLTTAVAIRVVGLNYESNLWVADLISSSNASRLVLA